MNNTELVKISHELINNIEEAIKDFVSIYSAFYFKKSISEDEMRQQIRELLLPYNREELIEYNEMCKMFSDSNCGYIEFMTGRIIHEEIIKILYPRD